MTLSLRTLLQATGGRLISGYPTSVCQNISIDTRSLKPGDLFFALQGPRFDGHAFLRTACQKQAKAVVVHRMDDSFALSLGTPPDIVEVPDTLKALQDTARYIRLQANKTVVIGITGSNGKTTTKEMLASILKRAGKTLATRGNLNNHIGMPMVLSELEADHRFAVIEMGTSKKGDMELLADLARPQVGLITNVGKDHLEFLETPEGVLEENRHLYDSLPKDGVAIVNAEDPLLKRLPGHLRCRTITYGRVSGVDIQAKDIVSFPAPVRFTLQLGKESCKVMLHVLGEIQVINALAAAATAHAIGVSTQDIVEGLESFTPAAMRGEVHVRKDNVILVNDAYNANPSSMRASIESFCRSYPDRPRWLVLGDMRELGGIARQEHRDLGRWIAAQSVDRILLYGRDTRFVLQGATEHGYRGIIERYYKKRYLIESLKRSLNGTVKPAVLFKASRSLQLEQVNHALLSLPA